VMELVRGCDAIVHLGGISVERPFDEVLPANIQGTYDIYEAARVHGVRRIVFASSNHVTGFYRQGEILDADTPPRPDGYYGISKAFGENLSRFYFDRYGIETVCLRIGSSFPEARDRRMLVTWLSYDDLTQLVVRSLFTPKVGHTIVYGASANRDRWWDNHAARHLGFEPKDSSERFRAAVEAQPAPGPDDPAAQYQGGAFVKEGPFCTWTRRGRPSGWATCCARSGTARYGIPPSRRSTGPTSPRAACGATTRPADRPANGRCPRWRVA